MGELGFSFGKLMKLFCDNQSTIKIVENPIQYDRTKYVEIDKSFIYEKLENKEIEVPYVRTKGRFIDMLTLSNLAFSNSLIKLGKYDICSTLRGSIEYYVQLLYRCITMYKTFPPIFTVPPIYRYLPYLEFCSTNAVQYCILYKPFMQ